MEKGKEVVVERFPNCDFCQDQAAYDAKTKNGMWANLCELHWRSYAASTQLGIGKGQRLVIVRDN